MTFIKNRKNILLIILILGVLVMTISYAAFTTKLNIIGTANTTAVNWNIHFRNWQKIEITTVDGHTNKAEYPQVSELTMSDTSNVTKVEGINVTLNEPKDIARYNFEIINEGSIDAKLDNFTSNLSPNSEAIGYQVKCFESNTREGTEITTDSVLAPNGVAYCFIEVKLNDATNGTQVAGTNQIYVQSPVSISVNASWTWVQNPTSIPAQITVQGVKCENGQLINNTNWCLTNPGATLKNQKFEYWLSDSEKYNSGWHDIEDLYGISQTYYFQNGYAYIGWLEENGDRYFLSDLDDDNNGYVNCNLIKNETRKIENECYSFDLDGISTLEVTPTTLNSNYVESAANTLLCNLGGRSFYKAYDGEALVGYYFNGTYGHPLLVSENSSAVAFKNSSSYSVFNYTSTYEYKCKTYYVSSWEYGMPNSTSTSGIAPKIGDNSTEQDEAVELLLKKAFNEIQ